MRDEIVINAELGETRVALIENGRFAELHIERERDKSVVGNVVKGRVSRVLPGMQAAFVDIGLEKAAFLYVGDYFESVLETGQTEGEPGSGGHRRNGGRGRKGRSAPPRIDTVLREGQEIVVQIAKEPIGSKGARITSSLSIPGRHLVLTPWSRRVGVSRRIGSDKERRRLREVVERLRPKNLGFIIRTAGDGVTEDDLKADIRYLATVWAAIQQRHAEQSAPALLYSEHDLPLRIVRDLAGHDTKRIIADNKDVYDNINSFVERFVADPKPKIEYYDKHLPIFESMDLERQINANLERKVWLKSGGSLVIDKSEALTAIDVNTGRFVGKSDLEETVLRTNLEAVAEVVHQLRFRNLGGLIIIDLIDMESAANREKVYRSLQEALRADKSRTNILKISELGLIEMTRKRTRENLVQTLCEPCSYCEGRSYVMSSESVGFRVLREIRKHLPKLRGRSVAVAVSPHVAEELLTGSKKAMANLSKEIGKDIEVRARPGMHQERFELSVLDSGVTVELDLPWLRDRHPDAARDTGANAESADNTENNTEDSTKNSVDGSAEKSTNARRNGRRRGRGGRSRGDAEQVIAEGAIPAAGAASTEDHSDDDPDLDNADNRSDDSVDDSVQEANKPLEIATPAESDSAPSEPARLEGDALPVTDASPVTDAQPSASESVSDAVGTSEETNTETGQPVDSEAESRIIPRSK
jgi:ribonuclease G